MVRVLTKNGGFDYVKKEFVAFYVEQGYILAVIHETPKKKS